MESLYALILRSPLVLLQSLYPEPLREPEAVNVLAVLASDRVLNASDRASTNSSDPDGVDDDSLSISVASDGWRCAKSG